MEIIPGRAVYFVSDVHLGTPDHRPGQGRERLFLEWLEFIQEDVQALFIVGDLFDCWYEYKHAVPKGFVRTLGALAKFTDHGIPVYFFTGNHDLWLIDYFQKELQWQVYDQPQQFQIGRSQIFIGHGDGLGPGDHGYKRLKKILRFKPAQALYRWLHPDLGLPLARFFSATSRSAGHHEPEYFLGAEKEWLVQYCLRKMEQGVDADFFIFGHRHLVIDYMLPNQKRYINLGDWISQPTYARLDTLDFILHHWTLDGSSPISIHRTE